MTFYDILQISKDATQTEIKKAYHTLAKQYHPDKNKSPDAETLFKEIKEAYETLSDPNKRTMYDLTGSVNVNLGTPGDMNNPNTTFFGFDIFSDIDIDIMFADINEILKEKENMFKSYPQEPKIVDAPPTHINCNASIEDVYKGTIKEVAIDQISPHGTEKKTFYLALNRREHVFPKEGNYNCINERPGDLIFTVYLKRHPCFKRLHSIDLLYLHPIPLDTFLKNEPVKMTLPDNKRIRLKPNQQQFHVIENKGFLKDDGINRGRLFIYFQIQFKDNETNKIPCISSLIHSEI